MITSLGQEKLCDNCDGQSDVNVDDSSGTPEFYRYCRCTGKIALTAEELKLAQYTYELRQKAGVSTKPCGGWTAIGE